MNTLKRHAFIAAGALLALASPAFTQVQKYTEIKTPALRSFTVVQPKRIQLANGMVIFLQEDHELPLIRGGARIRGRQTASPGTGEIGVDPLQLVAGTGTVRRHEHRFVLGRPVESQRARQRAKARNRIAAQLLVIDRVKLRVCDEHVVQHGHLHADLPCLHCDLVVVGRDLDVVATSRLVAELRCDGNGRRLVFHLHPTGDDIERMAVDVLQELGYAV